MGAPPDKRAVIRRVAVVILGTATFFAVVVTSLGGAIALRHTRNSVGWIFLGSGMLAALMEAAQEYASDALCESLAAGQGHRTVKPLRRG